MCGRAGIRLDCRGCDSPSIVPYRCRSRTCPHAQRAGAAAMSDRILARVRVHDAIMENEPWDGLGRKKKRGWKLLTLTCPIGLDADANWRDGNLRDGARRVRAAWARFWRYTAWGRQVRDDGSRRSRKRARKDTSAILAVEIGPTNGMPHIHALVYGEYLEHAELAGAWARALGVAAFVHISAVKGDVADAISEVIKYVAKGTGDELLNPKRAAAIEVALRNFHRASVTGALRRVTVAESDGEKEDVRQDDVHATKVAACEDCGCIGEWRWAGVVAPVVVERNRGFGLLGPKAIPQFGEDESDGPGSTGGSHDALREGVRACLHGFTFE